MRFDSRLALVVFFAFPSAASAVPLVRLHLKIENGAVEAVSRLDLDEEIRFAPPGEGLLEWRVLDAAGVPLAAGSFDDPSIVHYDFEDETGALRGGDARDPDAHFFLKVPSPPGAASVEFRDRAGERRGEAVLAAVPRAGGAAAAGWAVEELWHSGPSSQRLDVVFVGDGYTAAEGPTLRAHAQQAVDYLLGTRPYSTHMGAVNVWVVYVQSAQSGADEPDAVPPVFVSTALDASYDWGGTDRCLYANSAKVIAAAGCVAAVDEIVVPVNHARYGGCGGGFGVYAAGNGAALEIAVHEFGHSFTGLADEYDYADGSRYTGSEFGSANSTKYDRATVLAQRRKWWYWVGVPGQSIDVFEGSSYHEFGAYRPHVNCKMRSLGPDFCAVCCENKIKGLYALCPPIQGSSPSANPTVPAGASVVLAVTMPPVATLAAEWTVDGVVQPGGADGSFTYHASRYPSGAHAVEAVAADSTPLVLSDPGGLLVDSRAWTVTSTGSFTVTSIEPAAGPQSGGDRIRIEGGGLGVATEARFGGLLGLDFVREADGSLSVTTPASTVLGSVDVVLSRPGGSLTVPAGFEYEPNPITLVYTGGAPRGGGYLAFTVGGPPNSLVALVLGSEQGTFVAKGIETCTAGPRSADFEIAVHPLRDGIRTDATGRADLVVPLDLEQWQQRFVNVYVTAAVKSAGTWRGSECAIATVFP